MTQIIITLPAKWWAERAEKIVDRWGLQEFVTLLLAITAEIGELMKSDLETQH